MNVGVANRIRDTVSITANKLEKKIEHSRPIGLKLHVHVYKGSDHSVTITLVIFVAKSRQKTTVDCLLVHSSLLEECLTKIQRECLATQVPGCM